MNKIKFLVIVLVLVNSIAYAQQVPVVISNATIHVGDGSIINNGMVIFKNGKLEYVGINKNSGYDENTASLIDGTGKHVYPGFIVANSELGLIELSAVRATRDTYEVGVFNSNVRSLISYNTDSKVIPTLRSNGVLIAQIVPGGGIISGQSSIVKLAGWNWEDAAIATDKGMHIYWPEAYGYNYYQETYELSKTYTSQVNNINSFTQEAKAYCNIADHQTKNLRFEAMRKVFSGEQKMFVKANTAKSIIGAVEYGKKFGIQIVIVGGTQSYRVIELLRENNIPVILETTHELPPMSGDPIDLVYKLPYLLTKAGILCGLTLSNGGDSYWNSRNLPFVAGSAAAYGLTKEEALQLITLNNAKILGIDGSYGTLTTGKSATLFVSQGDALDMKTSILTNIFINGERMKVENWQDDLNKKYEIKYGIEVK